jgi:hypothetical protein
MQREEQPLCQTMWLIDPEPAVNCQSKNALTEFQPWNDTRAVSGNASTSPKAPTIILGAVFLPRQMQ